MSYTFYIDESGDAGIKKIRTGNAGGASPYMTMGGVLIPDSLSQGLEKNLDELKASISLRTDLHCKSLTHEQKVRFSQFLGQQNVTCFGVISLKSTLGSYNNNSGYYYNKCAQYLLERLGIYLETQNNISPNEVKIIFEHGNYEYQKLKGLIATCQRNPIHPNTAYLKNIDVNLISSEVKDEKPLLQLADLVAHALYKTVDGGTRNVTEQRYLKEIKSSFYSQDGKIIGKGLYPVHSIYELKLEPEIMNFYTEMAA